MLSGYAKLGMVKDSSFICDPVVENDLFCWSVVIFSSTENDQPYEALQFVQ